MEVSTEPTLRQADGEYIPSLDEPEVEAPPIITPSDTLAMISKLDLFLQGQLGTEFWQASMALQQARRALNLITSNNMKQTKLCEFFVVPQNVE